MLGDSSGYDRANIRACQATLRALEYPSIKIPVNGLKSVEGLETTVHLD
jgi:hypothetical protein